MERVEVKQISLDDRAICKRSPTLTPQLSSRTLAKTYMLNAAAKCPPLYEEGVGLTKHAQGDVAAAPP